MTFKHTACGLIIFVTPLRQIHPSRQSIWMTTMKNELKCLALGIAGRQDERQVTTETEKVTIFLGGFIGSKPRFVIDFSRQHYTDHGFGTTSHCSSNPFRPSLHFVLFSFLLLCPKTAGFVPS